MSARGSAVRATGAAIVWAWRKPLSWLTHVHRLFRVGQGKGTEPPSSETGRKPLDLAPYWIEAPAAVRLDRDAAGFLWADGAVVSAKAGRTAPAGDPDGISGEIAPGAARVSRP